MKEIDEKVLFVSVIPSESSFKEFDREGVLAEEVLNISSWFALSFKLNKLELMVQFTNPLQISARDDREWLQIVFLDHQKFTNQDGQMRLA